MTFLPELIKKQENNLTAGLQPTSNISGGAMKLKKMKLSLQSWSPSMLAKFKRICREEWQNIPKSVQDWRLLLLLKVLHQSSEEQRHQRDTRVHAG